MRKVMRFRTWGSEPVVTLGETTVGVEAFTFAGGRWVDVSPVRIIPNASEIGEVKFGLRYPMAYRARRWLPKAEAARDPKDVRLDNMMIAAHEALEAERRAQEGASPPPPSAPPDTGHEPPDEAA